MNEKLPKIAVHGRFQPPLHINHWAYIQEAFERADQVQILITNPFQDEAFEATASWRNDPLNNPFSYSQRVEMFKQFFQAVKINSDRYDFSPFNIKDDQAFSHLDQKVPNLVNIYSEWSAKKADLFRKHGLEVIALEKAKSIPASGTLIRSIIKNNPDLDSLESKLIEAGFMPEAVPGLLTYLRLSRK